jgi:hypothetical protein
LTLVLALRCREGAVLAADDQLTYREGIARGDTRVTRTTAVTKLHAVRGIAWGWGGRVDAQQRFSVELYEERELLAGARRTHLQDQVEDALRTSLAKVSDNADLNLLLSWWSPYAGKALILRAGGLGSAINSTFVDDRHNVELIGSPQAVKLAEFALRTLGFGDFRDVGMEEAKVVAYKVISDVSAFTDDVGQPRQIIGITKDGVEELDAQDVQAIATSADVWTTKLRATLAEETEPPPTEGHDPGVRPPR